MLLLRCCCCSPVLLVVAGSSSSSSSPRSFIPSTFDRESSILRRRPPEDKHPGPPERQTWAQWAASLVRSDAVQADGEWAGAGGVGHGCRVRKSVGSTPAAAPRTRFNTGRGVKLCPRLGCRGLRARARGRGQNLTRHRRIKCCPQALGVRHPGIKSCPRAQTRR